mmetsp:Transcript_28055/g.90715  ORF Transcript_28055/g.90715 Transcript_28055/m.90715 type:complete len:249 (-) Transcript_28055:204-950(-)
MASRNGRGATAPSRIGTRLPSPAPLSSAARPPPPAVLAVLPQLPSAGSDSSRLDSGTDSRPEIDSRRSRQDASLEAHGNQAHSIAPSGAGSGCSPHSAVSHRPEERLSRISATRVAIATSVAARGMRSRCRVSSASDATANAKLTSTSPEGSGRRSSESVAASHRSHSGRHSESSVGRVQPGESSGLATGVGPDGSAAADATSMPSASCQASLWSLRRRGRAFERDMRRCLEPDDACHPVDLLAVREL